MKKKNGRLSIGTSNIVIPGNKLAFPPAFQHTTRLHYYSSLFNSVELNSTFYKIPQKNTFQKWAQDVPDGFTFSIKLFKEITHVKELKTAFNKIDDFISAAEGLEEKKGCLLIQFPGKITIDYYTQVQEIISHLDQFDGRYKWRKAVEFRSNSWYVSETYEMLNEYNVSLVLHDIPKSKNASLWTNTDFAYIRFHGEEGDYRGSYPDAILQARLKQVKEWLNEGIDVYAYFNNTIGSAFQNAQTIKRMFKMD